MAAFEDVYNSNWYVIGNKLKTFEEQYSRFNEVEHTIGVTETGYEIFTLSPKGWDCPPYKV